MPSYPLAAACFLAGVITVIAQQKPDFSGEWTLNRQASTLSFRYELQDDGRRLRAAEQLRGGGRDQDNLWVFERP